MDKLSFIPVMGTEQKIIAQDLRPGHVYFSTDTKRIYMDADTRLMMGGNSGIHYGKYQPEEEISDEVTDFEFTSNDLEKPDEIPNVNDLILNIPDGCFYRVIEVSEKDGETIIYVRRLTIAGSGGGSGGGEAVGGYTDVKWITSNPIIYFGESDCFIEFDTVATDKNNNNVEYGHYYNLTVNSKVVVRNEPVSLNRNKINIKQYLTESNKDYNVKIEVYMSRGQGAPTKYYITYIVKTPVVKLTWDYNQATLNSLENDFVLNDWSFSGEGQNKKLHIILNDYQEIDTLPMGDKVDVLNYSFNPIEKSISHGVYKLEIYGSLEINGQYVETEHISYQVIFYDKNNKATIVSCLLTDYNLTQYTSINIPYVIYYPNNTVEGSATVELIENNDEENKVVLTNRQNGVVYNWLYTPKTPGTNIPLIIRSHNSQVSILVNIEALNLGTVEEVEDYSFKFKASDLVDKEELLKWAAAGNATFSPEFDWLKGGLKQELDEKEYPRQYLLIKKGSYIDMNTPLFANSASTSGLSFKLIYKVLECRDYDAEFFRCAEQINKLSVDEEIELNIPEETSISYSGLVKFVNGNPQLDMNALNSGTITYKSTDIDVLNKLNNKFFSYDNNIYHFSYYIDPNKNNAIIITFSSTKTLTADKGIIMRAQEAEIITDTANLKVPYYENSYIELEFDIAKNDSTEGFKGRYIKPWLDGVPCGVTLYDTDDKIIHSSKNNIVRIGSNQCDVCLYLYKVYNKSLTDEEHFNNFVMDASSGQEIYDRFKRNDIISTDSSGNKYIDYNKLTENNPGCYTHLYSIERMTRSKSDKVGVYRYSQYLNGKEILRTANDNIEEGAILDDNSRKHCGARMKVQGTSSASYGVAAFNMDTDFVQLDENNNEFCTLLDMVNLTSIEDEYGSVTEEPTPLLDGWSMDEEAIPCTFFCTKVNVASAEGANNALNQEWYNYHQPYIGAARQRNYDANGNLKSGPKYRDTMQFKPGVVFIKDYNPLEKINDDDPDMTDTHLNVFKEIKGYVKNPYYRLYSIGCMGNSKDNVHVFHTDTECCIENGDNQLPGQWMTICPGAYEENGKTYYVDLDNIDKDKTTYIPELGEEKNNYQLWKDALDDVYEFRYPDGIDEALEMYDEEGNNLGEKMMQGWFRFVKWMSTSDPMPKYIIENSIVDEESFNKVLNERKLYLENIIPPEGKGLVEINNDNISIKFDAGQYIYYADDVAIINHKIKLNTYNNYIIYNTELSENELAQLIEPIKNKYIEIDGKIYKVAENDLIYSSVSKTNYQVSYINTNTYINGNTYYSETDHVHGYDNHLLEVPITFTENDVKFTDNVHSKTLMRSNIKFSNYTGTFTHDTADYRVAKMLSECEDYLVMDSIVYHYLFIERHCMIDNVAKNTFWSSSDYIHWDLTKDYDNDTADGNDNQGHLTLNYGYEIGDTLNGVSVFNAGNSVWLNFIRQLFNIRKGMYKTLSESGAWNPGEYLEKFNQWQSVIPERCWIEDYYRKYIRPWEIFNNNSYLPRLEGGKKTYQRAQYENYQNLYMNSQYQSDTNTSAALGFRPSGTGQNENISLNLETYADGYINIALGSGSDINHSVRVKRNEPYTWNTSANLTNATLYFFNPQLFQEIGDSEILYNSLAIFNPSEILGAERAKRLRKLVYGKIGEKVNTALKEFTVSGMEMLEELYACNLQSTTTNSLALNLRNNKNISYVDGRNSIFSTVTIQDAPLETLLLTQLTSLVLSNISKLKIIEIEKYDSIENLTLINIDQNNFSSLSLLKNVLENSSVFKTYNIQEVSWNLNSTEFIDEDNGITILNALLSNSKIESIPSQSLSGKLIVQEAAYNGDKSLEFYEKYSHKDVYPKLDIEFLGTNSKLYTVDVVDGNNKIIWTRKTKPDTQLSNTFFIGEENYIPSLGILDVDSIQKSNTNTQIFTKTGTWNIYNADTNELLAEQVSSDENGYPIYNENINSNIKIEHYFAVETRYYDITIYDGDNITVLQEFKGKEGGIEYETPLSEIMKRINKVPYKNDINLSLKATYSHIGYNTVPNSSSALPNYFKINDNFNFYSVFKEIDDITTLEVNYDYFDFGLTPNKDYYELTPKNNLQLSGKILLPTSYNGLPVQLKGFSSQTAITHVFFEKNRNKNSKIIILGQAFEKLEKLCYFEFIDEIENIIDNAFYQNRLNTELYDNHIVLGKSLTFIGASAFNASFISKSNAYTIELPDNLIKVGSGAFSYLGIGTTPTITFIIGTDNDNTQNYNGNSQLDLSQCGDNAFAQNGSGHNIIFNTSKYTTSSEEILRVFGNGGNYTISFN